tara:strand:- start:2469 stop:3803 length:1335 start_codon:yes stop_codon:yes gene_type:complete
MRYRRSPGITISEEVLADLCDRSFFKLWTYPNLFKKPGKELVDLLVVFKNTILLFSDKSCAFGNSGSAEVDWKRWYKKSISDSAHQIGQAERWLRACPDRVYLDGSASELIPIHLPRPEDVIFHRICIVSGIAESALAITGRESLAIDPKVRGDEAAFTIGNVTDVHGIFHVFDSETLMLMLRELDTIGDFIDYLSAKENLLNSTLFDGASSEADLLAYYLWNGRAFPVQAKRYRLQPNLWRQVEGNAAFQEGRRLNQRDQFWDALINSITQNYLDETLEFGNELQMNEYEQAVRIMASETRFFRRILSDQIMQRVGRTDDGYTATLIPSEQEEVLYVLLVGPGAEREEYEDYRSYRTQQLRFRCYAAKAARPAIRYFVGIGLDNRRVAGGSEDFICLDTEDWVEEDLAKANQIRNDTGYFVEGRMIERSVEANEYPEIDCRQP